MSAGDEQNQLASTIERLSSGYLPSLVLFAAVELGLFDALDRERTLPELAETLGANVDGMRRLCRVLASMQLLTMRADCVQATPEALRLLSRTGEQSMVDLVRHHQRQVAPLFLQLATAVRNGRPQHHAWPFATPPVAETAYGELVRHPQELQAFVMAMDHASRGVGAALVGELRERGVTRLVDLGCGGGAIARELLAEMPELAIESFDLGPVATIARKRSIGAGLVERHRVAAGDILAGVESRGADAVLLSAVLADWTRDERAAILAGARRSLRPNGYLFVSETLLDDDRLGPPGAAFFSLVMLLAMRGDQLSARELLGELERAGFIDVHVRRGAPRDLVIARASD